VTDKGMSQVMKPEIFDTSGSESRIKRGFRTPDSLMGQGIGLSNSSPCVMHHSVAALQMQ
jgi:hypothetical protein